MGRSMKDRKLYPVKTFFLIASVILILPFAALSVYFALHTVSESKKMVASANRSALHLYQQELSSNLEQLEQYLVQNWAQDWRHRMLQYEQNAIDAHESTRDILESYKAIQSVYSCVGSMAIYSQANQLCRCTYYNEYSHDLRQAVKAYVEKINFEESVGEWYVDRIDGEWFLVRVVGLSNAYSVCFVDLQLGSAIEYQEEIMNPTYLVYLNDSMEVLNREEQIEGIRFDIDHDEYYSFAKYAGDNFMVVQVPLGYGEITMAYIMKYSGFGQMTVGQMFAVALTFLMLLLVPLVYYIVCKIFFGPLNAFIQSMHESRKGNIPPRLLYTGSLEELNEFSDTFNSMMKEIEKLKIDSYERELAKQKAEFQYLQQQLKPHFYLNCLKTLYGIIQLKHMDKAQKMILGVSEYIRYTFRNNSILVQLAEEVHQVENYVQIQQASIATKVILNIEIPADTEQAYVPIMCIQTFVENSFKYGVCSDRNLEIRISADIIHADEESYLDISIQDNGQGFSEEVLDEMSGNKVRYEDGTATGIRNIKQRLEIFYQSRAGITCMNNYQGALCELIIPLEMEPELEKMQGGIVI